MCVRLFDPLLSINIMSPSFLRSIYTKVLNVDIFNFQTCSHLFEQFRSSQYGQVRLCIFRFVLKVWSLVCIEMMFLIAGGINYFQSLVSRFEFRIRISRSTCNYIYLLLHRYLLPNIYIDQLILPPHTIPKTDAQIEYWILYK